MPQAVNPCVPVGKACALVSAHRFAGALPCNANSLPTRLSRGMHRQRRSQRACRAPGWTPQQCDRRQYRKRRNKHRQKNKARSCLACVRAAPAARPKTTQGQRHSRCGVTACGSEHNAALRKTGTVASTARLVRRLRVTWRYVLRPATAAHTDRCARARKDWSGLRCALVPRDAAALRRQSDGT